MNFSLTLCLACLALVLAFLTGYSLGCLASSFKMLEFTDWSDTQSDTQSEPNEQAGGKEHTKDENKEKVE